MISPVQRTNFYKKLSSHGYRTREPFSDELTPENPMLASSIAGRLTQIGMTPYEIAKMTGFRDESTNTIFTSPMPTPRLRLV